MYSYRIEQAIRAAAVLHEGQVRKGELPLPFITHPFSVAMSLLSYTDNENVIVAAILHDTFEDTNYDTEEMVNDFDENIAIIVATVSEPKEDEFGNKLSWVERKNEYNKQIAEGPLEAVYVSAADKIHNFRAIIEEYYDEPERYLNDFGRNITERLEVHVRMAEIITDRLDNDELREEFTYIFDKYVQFLNEISERYETN